MRKAAAPAPAASKDASGRGPGSAKPTAQSPLSVALALGGRDFGAHLAAALGLSDDVPVHLDAEARQRTTARGAPAVATRGAVYLDPARFDPNARAGQYLVAHEMVHVAQSRLTGTAPIADAEAEADAAARMWVDRGTLVRPRVPLARDAVAAAPTEIEKPVGKGTAAALRRYVFETAATDGASISETYQFAVEDFGREGPSRKRLTYTRRVIARTDDGLAVMLEIEGRADFPRSTPDADAKAMIDVAGSGVVRGQVSTKVRRGERQDWYGFEFTDSGFAGVDAPRPMRAIAAQGMRFMHFGLTPRDQVDTLLAEVRRRLPPPRPRPNQRMKPAPPRAPKPPAPTPPEPKAVPPKKSSLDTMTEEEFGRLSRDDKGELARDAIGDAIDWGTIGRNVLIALGVLVLGVLAIAAAVAGFVGLAVALAAAIVVAAIAGLVYLLKDGTKDFLDRIADDDTLGASLSAAKTVAAVVGVVLGTIALVLGVAAAIVGAPFIAGGLVAGAIVAGVIAIGIGVFLAWRDYDRAKDAPDLGTFRQRTSRAARTLEGAISDVVTTIVTTIAGKVAARRGRSGGAPRDPGVPNTPKAPNAPSTPVPVAPPPTVIQPPQVAPPAPPVPEIPQVAPPGPVLPETPQVAPPTVVEPTVTSPSVAPGATGGRDPVVDLPPGAKIVKPPKPKPQKAPSARDRVIAIARDKLAGLKESQTENKAHLERLDAEIADAIADVNRAKEALRKTTRGTMEHAEAQRRLKEAQEVLKDDEGGGLYDEQRGTVEERANLTAREEKILASLKLQRPALSKALKDLVLGRAKRNAAGQYLDANTGEPIVGEPVFGHVYGREHRRLALEAAEKNMSQSEFNEWVNAHPEWFQVETKANNESHRFEKPGID